MKGIEKTAHDLRERQTQSELLFGQYLMQMGIEFKAQEALCGYVPDFYFPAYGHRIIELDGQFHNGREARDEHRDRVLKQNGFEVKRFPSHMVFSRPRELMELVAEFLKRPTTKVPKGIRKRRKKAKKLNTPTKWQKVEKLNSQHLPIHPAPKVVRWRYKAKKVKGWEPSKPRQIKIVKVMEDGTEI